MITELNIHRRGKGVRWCTNFYSDDASGGAVIKTVTPTDRIWLDSVIVSIEDGEQFEILNGDLSLIGPVILKDTNIWKYRFLTGINLDVGSFLKVKTESETKVHVLVEGTVDQKPEISPSPSPSASASASPSEGA